MVFTFSNMLLYTLEAQLSASVHNHSYIFEPCESWILFLFLTLLSIWVYIYIIFLYTYIHTYKPHTLFLAREIDFRGKHTHLPPVMTWNIKALHTWTYMYIIIYTIHEYVHIRQVCTCVCTCVSACACACACAHPSRNVCAYVCVCVNLYVHM